MPVFAKLGNTFLQIMQVGLYKGLALKHNLRNVVCLKQWLRQGKNKTTIDKKIDEASSKEVKTYGNKDR